MNTEQKIQELFEKFGPVIPVKKKPTFINFLFITEPRVRGWLYIEKLEHYNCWVVGFTNDPEIKGAHDILNHYQTPYYGIYISDTGDEERMTDSSGVWRNKICRTPIEKSALANRVNRITLKHCNMAYAYYFNA